MKKLYLLSLLLCSGTVFAWPNLLHEMVKPVAGMRQSLFGLNQAKVIDGDQECQNLGKEAQDALKIPLHDQLPIKYIPEGASFFSDAYATAGPNAIYINQKAFSCLPYAEKRSILFHEAVHVKYCDVTGVERCLVKIAGLAGIAKLGTKFFPIIPTTLKKYLEIVHSTLEKHGNTEQIYSLATCVIGSIVLYAVMNAETHEGRADREGAYASDCYECVRIQARSAPVRYGINEWDQRSPLAKGYLSRQDLESISEELKLKNRLCKVHLNSTLKCTDKN